MSKELVEETWIDCSAPDYDSAAASCRKRHMAVVEESVEQGKPHLIEIMDPEQPEATRYIRYGTDKEMMKLPKEISLEQNQGLASGAVPKA